MEVHGLGGQSREWHEEANLKPRLRTHARGGFEGPSISVLAVLYKREYFRECFRHQVFTDLQYNVEKKATPQIIATAGLYITHHRSRLERFRCPEAAIHLTGRKQVGPQRQRWWWVGA